MSTFRPAKIICDLTKRHGSSCKNIRHFTQDCDRGQKKHLHYNSKDPPVPPSKLLSFKSTTDVRTQCPVIENVLKKDDPKSRWFNFKKSQSTTSLNVSKPQRTTYMTAWISSVFNKWVTGTNQESQVEEQPRTTSVQATIEDLSHVHDCLKTCHQEVGSNPLQQPAKQTKIGITNKQSTCGPSNFNQPQKGDDSSIYISSMQGYHPKASENAAKEQYGVAGPVTARPLTISENKRNPFSKPAFCPHLATIAQPPHVGLKKVPIDTKSSSTSKLPLRLNTNCATSALKKHTRVGSFFRTGTLSTDLGTTSTLTVPSSPLNEPTSVNDKSHPQGKFFSATLSDETPSTFKSLLAKNPLTSTLNNSATPSKYVNLSSTPLPKMATQPFRSRSLTSRPFPKRVTEPSSNGILSSTPLPKRVTERSTNGILSARPLPKRVTEPSSNGILSSTPLPKRVTEPSINGIFSSTPLPKRVTEPSSNGIFSSTPLPKRVTEPSSNGNLSSAPISKRSTEPFRTRIFSSTPLSKRVSEPSSNGNLSSTPLSKSVTKPSSNGNLSSVPISKRSTEPFRSRIFSSTPLPKRVTEPSSNGILSATPVPKRITEPSSNGNLFSIPSSKRVTEPSSNGILSATPVPKRITEPSSNGNLPSTPLSKRSTEPFRSRIFSSTPLPKRVTEPFSNGILLATPVPSRSTEPSRNGQLLSRILPKRSSDTSSSRNPKLSSISKPTESSENKTLQQSLLNLTRESCDNKNPIHVLNKCTEALSNKNAKSGVVELSTCTKPPLGEKIMPLPLNGPIYSSLPMPTDSNNLPSSTVAITNKTVEHSSYDSSHCNEDSMTSCTIKLSKSSPVEHMFSDGKMSAFSGLFLRNTNSQSNSKKTAPPPYRGMKSSYSMIARGKKAVENPSKKTLLNHEVKAPLPLVNLIAKIHTNSSLLTNGKKPPQKSSKLGPGKNWGSDFLRVAGSKPDAPKKDVPKSREPYTPSGARLGRSAFCRRDMSKLIPKPKEHCMCEPRNAPPPRKQEEAEVCPPKPARKMQSSCKTTFRLPGCKVAINTTCNRDLASRPPCVKPEAPEPSFSECVRAMPPLPFPSECRITEKQRFLQPNVPILNTWTFKMSPPIVEPIIDPCKGECCKPFMLSTGSVCASKVTQATVRQCLIEGKRLTLPGCLIPASTTCPRKFQQRKPCIRPLAPVPSYSECKKQPFRKLPLRECYVAEQRAKIMSTLLAQGVQLTLEAMSNARCKKPGIIHNCQGYEDQSPCEPLARTVIACTKNSARLPMPSNTST